MWKNYLAAALRNLLRNRLYTAVNIGGLTIGFTAALLIARYLVDQLGYDRFIPGSESVYRVASEVQPALPRPRRRGAAVLLNANRVVDRRQARRVRYRELACSTIRPKNPAPRQTCTPPLAP